MEYKGARHRYLRFSPSLQAMTLKYSLLGVLVLRRRTLRAFEPADHVLHPTFSFIELKKLGKRYIRGSLNAPLRKIAALHFDSRPGISLCHSNQPRHRRPVATSTL